MNMNDIKIPKYFTSKDWKYFTTLEHLSTTEKMVTFVAYITDTEVDEVRKWTPDVLTNVYQKLADMFDDLEPTFFPIFELDGQLYGYSAIGKMTLGEYIDLEALAKNPNENMEQIMAILYRPIKKHKFNSVKWMVKSQYKVAVGKAENLFKYYELEEYNSNDRESNAEKLGIMPASFCIGALSFFLVLANTFLTGTNLYSTNQQHLMEKEMEKLKELISAPIGAGFRHFTTSRKVPSLALQEIKQLQI